MVEAGKSVERLLVGQAEINKADLILDGKMLPWVWSALHLGHVLHESGTMDQDIRTKRVRFIDESVDMRETFGFGSPPEVLRAVKSCMSAVTYGSMLWDLGSNLATENFNAYLC